MGIMYKLMQQRKDIKMDMRRAAEMNANERQPLVTADEKEFTAEHILQLCKFLAEKSKRNKTNLKQRQASSQCEALQQNNCFQFEPIDAVIRETEALPLLHDTERLSGNYSPTAAEITTKQTQKILCDNLSTTVAKNEDACTLPDTQAKRDILLKIRRQIFERKRQRQLAHQLVHMQQHCGSVWRPW